jgi:hypothetical protein
MHGTAAACAPCLNVDLNLRHVGVFMSMRLAPFLLLLLLMVHCRQCLGAFSRIRQALHIKKRCRDPFHCDKKLHEQFSNQLNVATADGTCGRLFVMRCNAAKTKASVPTR